MDYNQQNLFDQKPQQPHEQATLSVTDLNAQLKALLESNYSLVWLKAEISNFKPHSSGHFYFSLKDKKSQISAVMFRGFNSRLAFKPKDGMEVLIRGKISLYEPRGTYQILCESMEPVGAGALQKAFEELKRKLNSEGLFSENYKKKLVPIPQHIAVVTSPTSAALQDVLQVLEKRSPYCQVTLVPSLTQGARASKQIIEALVKADELNTDLILLVRGGGSLEDMWCFNDEDLARLIFDLQTPIVTGVGHEIDFTIADFVSDYRAPTPSAAAEVAALDQGQIVQKLSFLDKSLKSKITSKLEQTRQALQMLELRIVDPKKMVQDLKLKVSNLSLMMKKIIENRLSAEKSKILPLQKQVFQLVKQQVSNEKRRVELEFLKLDKLVISSLDKQKIFFKNLCSQLDSLSPLKIMSKGYGYLRNKKGAVVTQVEQAKVGHDLQVYLEDGMLLTEVKSVTKK